MTVLGVDPSLRATGLFLLEDGHVIGQAVSTGKMRGPARLVYIRDALCEMLEPNRPVLVAMESYSYGSIGKVFEIGELGGVLKVALYERGVPLILVAPVQLKKFVCGNTKAEKQGVIDAVNQELGLSLTPQQNDVADAAGLALIARAYLDPGSLTTRNRTEVIAAIRKSLTISNTTKPRPRRRPKLQSI